MIRVDPNGDLGGGLVDEAVTVTLDREQPAVRSADVVVTNLRNDTGVATPAPVLVVHGEVVVGEDTLLVVAVRQTAPARGMEQRPFERRQIVGPGAPHCDVRHRLGRCIPRRIEMNSRIMKPVAPHIVPSENS